MVVVVGIGNKVHREELLHMASNKTSHLFNATSFEELVSADFISNFRMRSCKLGNLCFRGIMYNLYNRIFCSIDSTDYEQAGFNLYKDAKKTVQPHNISW